MTQSNLASEQTGNLGFLPINYTPGLFKRLLGYSVFKIDSDCLILENGKKQKIKFEEICEIFPDAGRIRIKIDSGQEIILKTGDRSLSLTRIIEKLCAEKKLFNSFLSNLLNSTVEDDFAFFEKSLNFSSDTYINAASILVETAIRHEFSDLHLEPFSSGGLKVSWRIASEVFKGISVPQPHSSRIAARLKFLAGCLSHVSDQPQEGAFSNRGVSVRLSTFPTDAGERLSLRFINAVKFRTLKSLGWPDEIAILWKKRICEEKGLYIICGSVGSGKTTALYATLADLSGSCESMRVLTIEDPVEAYIESICQSSLDLMKESDLASAFKHLLRQDPDIIALGEIRDSACIKEALQAGLSGHIVLATFHAGSAEEAVDRIKQMGIEEYLVLSGLKGILHLSLLKDGDCLKPVVKFTSKVYGGY